jgi:hypothetical protein
LSNFDLVTLSLTFESGRFQRAPRLSIFPGDFTIEAARMVAAGGEVLVPIGKGLVERAGSPAIWKKAGADRGLLSTSRADAACATRAQVVDA